MTLLLGLHGAAGLTLLCLLLFLEEAGIPIPVAPGDGILIVAGVLIGNDAFPLPVFLLLAWVSVLAGALTGYFWTRRIGADGLAAVATRLRATQALERVSRRLRGTGSGGIALCRLIPGMRINTTLVAGAVGVDLRTFLVGVVPVSAAWVLGLTLLGRLVGLPAEHFMSRAGRVTADGVILVLVGLVGYLSLAYLPSRQGQHNALEGAPARDRIAIALLIDLSVVACIVFGLASLIRAGIGIGDVDGFIDVLMIVVVSVLTYVVLSRSGAGRSGGEVLLNIRYQPPGRRATHRPETTNERRSPETESGT